MGPYERRRGVTPAEQRDPTEGTPRTKRGARDDKAHDHNAGASTADRPSGEVCPRASKLKRRGFGWTRWSSETEYGTWGLFDDYQIRYRRRAKAAPTEKDA